MSVNNSSAVKLAYPYLDTLPKTERLWLRTYFRAETYRSHVYLSMLGLTPAQSDAVREDSNARENAFRRDLFWAGRASLFSSDQPEFTKVVSRETKQPTNDTYENIIDLARVVNRSLYAGYGDAANLTEGARVTLHIDGHRLNKRTGTVVRSRRGEWLIQFDPTRGFPNGIQGYFKANELANIQTMRLIA